MAQGFIRPRKDEEMDSKFPELYVVRYKGKLIGGQDMGFIQEYLGTDPGLEDKVEKHFREANGYKLETGAITLTSVQHDDHIPF